MDCQKKAFIDFSSGCVNVPLPLQLSFDNPMGDCHVKAGYNQLDDIFIVKIATGFYGNKENGLPTGDGAILVFSKSTGMLSYILCDNGFLTQVRTAIAACIASQLSSVNHICIVGTGNLGTLTYQMMKRLYPLAKISVWNRKMWQDLSSVLESCDTVITTTASHSALIQTHHIKSNMHIISLGADEPGKQELEPELFGRADHIIVDSKSQALLFGDTAYAISANIIQPEKLQELGAVLTQKSTFQNRLIITDLTGIAAQDIEMAKFIVG
eukprot:gene25450-33215_t